MKNCIVAVASFVLLLVLYGHASADTIGNGDNSFDIDFVTIGNPGNFASTFGTPSNAGAVDFELLSTPKQTVSRWS